MMLTGESIDMGEAIGVKTPDQWLGIRTEVASGLVSSPAD